MLPRYLFSLFDQILPKIQCRSSLNIPFILLRFDILKKNPTDFQIIPRCDLGLVVKINFEVTSSNLSPGPIYENTQEVFECVQREMNQHRAENLDNRGIKIKNRIWHTDNFATAFDRRVLLNGLYVYVFQFCFLVNSVRS